LSRFRKLACVIKELGKSIFHYESSSVALELKEMLPQMSEQFDAKSSLVNDFSGLVCFLTFKVLSLEFVKPV
jgi:hypothetical protein